MKKFIPFIASFLLLFSCSQSKTDLQAPVNVPGTRVMVSMPKDYYISKKFIGIEKDIHAGILIYDIPGGNYYTNAKDVDQKLFEAKGGKVFEFKETKVGKYPAKFMYLQSDPSKCAMMLVFGDTTFSCMLMAAFSPNNNTLAEEIRDILMHVGYDPKIKVDPFKIAAFSIDTTNTGFTFANYAGGMYVYSTSGNETPLKNEPVFIITQVPSEEIQNAKTLAKTMLMSLQQKGFIPLEQPIERGLPVDGLEAYESYAMGLMKGDSCLVYQLAAIKNEKAFIFQGFSKSNFRADLERFKSTAHTMRFK